MSNIKFHLHKFEKQLYFQLLHLDPLFRNKGFICLENNVCVVNYPQFSLGYELYHEGFRARNFINDSGNKTYFFNLSDRKEKVTQMSFKSNVERDFWYDRIISALGKSFENKMWVDCDNS